MSSANLNSRITIWLSFLVLVTAAAGIIWWQKPPAPAPDIQLVTLDGREITLAKLKGHPVLAVFWATDCPSCLQELPRLARLHQDYGKSGFQLLAIAMAYDPPNRVVEFGKRHPLPFPLILDPFGQIARAFGGVDVIPTQFLIGPDGNIVWRRTGLLGEADLRADIEALLKISRGES